MRQLNAVELGAVSGADIGYSALVSMWSDAGLYGSRILFNYELESQRINAIGFASATENKDWGHSTIGEAGWSINDAGQKVTWFNNGVFMAFKFG